MKLKFTGFVNIDDATDSLGDAEVELLWAIQDVFDNCRERDDVFEKLNLTFEVIDNAV